MMSKSNPRRPRNRKQPFLTLGFWYDAAFGPTSPRPRRTRKK
jgi:hypothetical protein